MAKKDPNVDYEAIARAEAEKNRRIAKQIADAAEAARRAEQQKEK